MSETIRNPHFEGQRLRALRQQFGLSGEQLARRADVSTRHVWRLEQEPHHPHVAAVTVARLAQVLHTSVEYLLGLTDDPTWATSSPDTLQGDSPCGGSGC
ncbi:MAG TPA: helix-turn-helix transcriptional regulator [Anaerolineae bacterium]|nr:helix-turn-helix transcriptional regulator [Anaerolineae bacterium]